MARTIWRRRLINILIGLCLLWICQILNTYSMLDMGNVLQSTEEKLQLLMKEEEFVDSASIDPFSKIMLSPEGPLHFYHLPKRKRIFTYTEITTANRDTSYPTAPDFTFHIHYFPDRVVLYEDYGPGCIYRLFLFPSMSLNLTVLHSLTSKDLHHLYLKIQVDGKIFKFNLQQVTEGRDWPFIYPISTNHKKPAAGMGSYVPICYQNSIVVSYIHPEGFPANLFHLNINCTLQGKLCPVHVYSAVSRHKFHHGTKVASFSESSNPKSLLRNNIKTAAHFLNNPELYGPDYHKPCILQCTVVCKLCKRWLLQQSGPGVVSSIKIRVFSTITGSLLADWNKVFLIGAFDHATHPQIKVPLGALFGASGSMNDFKGAAAGRRRKYCRYEHSFLELPLREMTGYVYFPMPFWRKADIYLEGLPSISTSHLVCFQVHVEQNHYTEIDTGYFHARKTFYTNHVGGYRDILSVRDSWGHIVGLYMDVENLKPIQDMPRAYRWATLEADPMLYIDGQKSATVMGTGLEDYFSYAHGFRLAENTTYSFVGVYHNGPKQNESLTWYSYRQHILDPIPFQESIHFLTEGTSRDKFSIPECPLPVEDFQQKKKNKESLLSHMVLYYSKPNKVGMTLIDSIVFGDSFSESDHKFRLLKAQAKSNTFTLPPISYLGASYANATYAKTGRYFKPGDFFEFQLAISQPSSQVLLRREFHSVPQGWNEQARISVNGQFQGRWFIPMGTLNEKYSLRHEDLMVKITEQPKYGQVTVQVEPETDWRDLSYQLFVIH